MDLGRFLFPGVVDTIRLKGKEVVDKVPIVVEAPEVGSAGSRDSSGEKEAQAEDDGVSDESGVHLQKADECSGHKGKERTVGAEKEAKRTYAGVTRGADVDPKPQVTKPVKVGDMLTFHITEEAMAARIEECKHSLIGRAVFSKGERPKSINEIKEVLVKAWGFHDWKLISMGRGFSHVFLRSQEDRNRAWGMGSVLLKPGIFRLQAWDPDFDPDQQKPTNAQV